VVPGGVGDDRVDVAVERVAKLLTIGGVVRGEVEPQRPCYPGIAPKGGQDQRVGVLRQREVLVGGLAGGRHDRSEVAGVSHQFGNLLRRPGQDGAAHAVRHHRDRAAAAEPFDLGNQQIGRLVEIHIRHRRDLGGQGLRGERTYGQALGPTGA
jgi:hypothetical protein